MNRKKIINFLWLNVIFYDWFQAHMKFPLDYPYSPPSIRFLTKVWHPNVYEVSNFVADSYWMPRWAEITEKVWNKYPDLSRNCWEFGIKFLHFFRKNVWNSKRFFEIISKPFLIFLPAGRIELKLIYTERKCSLLSVSCDGHRKELWWLFDTLSSNKYCLIHTTFLYVQIIDQIRWTKQHSRFGFWNENVRFQLRTWSMRYSACEK